MAKDTEIDTLFEMFIRGGDRQIRRSFLLKFYKDALFQDDQFHFLDEPGYLLVRYSPDLDETIRKYVSRKKKLTFDFRGFWKEHSNSVVKYSDFFAKLLHITSEFALSEYDKASYDEEPLFERMYHIQFNILDYMGFYPYSETNLLAQLAMRRSFAMGYYVGLTEKEEDKD